VKKTEKQGASDLYASTNVFQVVKSTQMRQMGHVVHTGRGEVHTGFWLGNLENSGTDGRIILKWISKKRDEGHGRDLSGLGQKQAVGSCECGNELPDAIKCRELLD
jgi:hypothetical protein